MNCRAQSAERRGSAILGNKNIIYVFTAIAGILLCISCAYTLTGNLPAHLQTIIVVPARSQVAEYGLGPDLTSYITEDFVSNGRLAVVTADASCKVESKITSWARTPYSYTSSEVVEEYKLQVRVEITFTDIIEDEVILNGENITTWIVYDPLNETESDAHIRLLHLSAEDIVDRCLSGW